MENLDPVTFKFVKGNKAAVGRGPKLKVRKWNLVLNELFALLINNPKELEKRIGIKIPEKIKHKDAQLLLVYRELAMALTGNLKASKEIKRWMDGDPTQNIELNMQSRSIVDIIKAGHAKREETDKKQK